MIRNLFPKTTTDGANTDLKPFSPHSLQVLIVEDDPTDQKLLARAMQNFGARHTTLAASGEEALRALSSRRFDVVLTDHGLPQMSGLELVETVREQWPRIQVILVTGARNEHVAAAAIKAGAWEYVSKDDFLTSGLIRAVQSAVRSVQQRDGIAIGGDETDATSLLRQSQAEVRWLRGTESMWHSGSQDLIMDDPQLDRCRAAMAAYMEECLRVFPVLPHREESSLVSALMARGSSPQEILRLAEEAMEVIEINAPQDATLAFRPMIYVSRLLMRMLEEYQAQLGLQALQDAA